MGLTRYLQSFGLLLSLSAAVVPASAEELFSESSADGSTVLEQVVSVPFLPKRAFVLLDLGRNSPLQYPAHLVVREQKQDGELEILAAGRIPAVMRASDDLVRYSFFLLGADGTFAAIPVREVSKDRLRAATRTETDLLQSMDELGQRLTLLRTEYEGVDHKLNQLRERASVLANVDEIVELKMKLSKLQSSGEDNSSERERLRTLIELGRQLGEPADIYSLLQELSLHLSETAKATALADRLNSRRREVAKASLNDRLALVKEMKNVDAEALGKEILVLRAKRKKLESQRQAPSGPIEEDQF